MLVYSWLLAVLNAFVLKLNELTVIVRENVFFFFYSAVDNKPTYSLFTLLIHSTTINIYVSGIHCRLETDLERLICFERHAIFFLYAYDAFEF